jgi:hypothetical protein
MHENYTFTCIYFFTRTYLKKCQNVEACMTSELYMFSYTIQKDCPNAWGARDWVPDCSAHTSFFCPREGPSLLSSSHVHRLAAPSPLALPTTHRPFAAEAAPPPVPRRPKPSIGGGITEASCRRRLHKS